MFAVATSAVENPGYSKVAVGTIGCNTDLHTGWVPAGDGSVMTSLGLAGGSGAIIHVENTGATVAIKAHLMSAPAVVVATVTSPGPLLKPGVSTYITFVLATGGVLTAAPGSTVAVGVRTRA